VQLVHQDIRHALPEGRFHLVLCRNLVFTYFDDALQRDLLKQIAGRLRANGVLVTGKKEKLPQGASTLVHEEPRLGIYRRES
jgi:chemotaxis protein methyltransferase CheR